MKSATASLSAWGGAYMVGVAPIADPSCIRQSAAGFGCRRDGIVNATARSLHCALLRCAVLYCAVRCTLLCGCALCTKVHKVAQALPKLHKQFQNTCWALFVFVAKRKPRKTHQQCRRRGPGPLRNAPGGPGDPPWQNIVQIR